MATHSQGSIVSTHLIEQLIREGHILTEVNMNILTKAAASIAPGGVAPSHGRTRPQKVCCLALCGIHLGPLRYLRTSSLLQPYIQVRHGLNYRRGVRADRVNLLIQYFENAAARELFDFQNTQSEVSQNYVKALQSVMDHGVRVRSCRLSRLSHICMLSRPRWCTSHRSTIRWCLSTQAYLLPHPILGSSERCISMVMPTSKRPQVIGACTG